MNISREMLLIGLSSVIIIATGIWAGYELGVADARSGKGHTLLDAPAHPVKSEPSSEKSAELVHSDLPPQEAIAPHAEELDRHGLVRIEADYETLLESRDHAAMIAVAKGQAYLYVDTDAFCAIVYRSTMPGQPCDVVHTMAVREGNGSMLVVGAPGYPKSDFPGQDFAGDSVSTFPVPLFASSEPTFDIAGEEGDRYVLFETGASPGEVRSFYLDTLSCEGWQYDRTLSEGAQKELDGELLIFKREDERILVYIRPEGNSSYVTLLMK